MPRLTDMTAENRDHRDRRFCAIFLLRQQHCMPLSSCPNVAERNCTPSFYAHLKKGSQRYIMAKAKQSKATSKLKVISLGGLEEVGKNITEKV